MANIVVADLKVALEPGTEAEAERVCEALRESFGRANNRVWFGHVTFDGFESAVVGP